MNKKTFFAKYNYIKRSRWKSPSALLYVVFLIPKNFLRIPPITFGLFTNTTFTNKSSYALQRAVPHITSDIASNTITNFSGRISEITNPRPKATKINPFIPERLPIKIPPAMYLLHYTQGVFICYI